jgi:hypothetical protein
VSLTLRSRATVTALTLSAFLAGCASLLGDFTSGDVGGADGGSDATTPGIDASSSGGSSSGSSGSSSGGGQDSSVNDAQNGVDSSSGGGEDGGTDGTLPPAEAGADGSVDGSHPDGGTDSGPKDAGFDAADSAAPWTPAQLDTAGKLALWLEPSSANFVISGGVVEQWNDLSKNANNASNTANGPVVVPNAINGHNALHFTTRGVTLDMADATSLQFGTDQIYITAVAQETAGTAYFFSKTTSAFGGAGSYYKSGLQFYAGSQDNDAGGTVYGPALNIDSTAGDEVFWGSSVFDDGKFHIVSFRRPNSFTDVLGVDDRPLQTYSTGSFDESQAGQVASVGSVTYGTFNQTQDFQLVEIVIEHTSVIPDADVANIHAYLKAKYKL